jgi:hypothetical protein
MRNSKTIIAVAACSRDVETSRKTVLSATSTKRETELAENVTFRELRDHFRIARRPPGNSEIGVPPLPAERSLRDLPILQRLRIVPDDMALIRITLFVPADAYGSSVRSTANVGLENVRCTHPSGGILGA